MDIRKKRLTYYCADCGDYTDTLHEVYHGYGKRQESIDNFFQVPLCMHCHNDYHVIANREQRGERVAYWLEWLGEKAEFNFNTGDLKAGKARRKERIMAAVI